MQPPWERCSICCTPKPPGREAGAIRGSAGEDSWLSVDSGELSAPEYFGHAPLPFPNIAAQLSRAGDTGAARRGDLGPFHAFGVSTSSWGLNMLWAESWRIACA